MEGLGKVSWVEIRGLFGVMRCLNNYLCFCLFFFAVLLFI